MSPTALSTFTLIPVWSPCGWLLSQAPWPYAPMDQAAVVSRAGRGSAARVRLTSEMNSASVAQRTPAGPLQVQPALAGS